MKFISQPFSTLNHSPKRTNSRSANLRRGLAWLALAAFLALNAWQPMQTPVVSGQDVTSNCQKLEIPAITHGFETTENLPSGDHFLLADPFTLAIAAPAPVNGAIPGVKTFTINPTTFGGDANTVGALRDTNPTGISYSTPNSRLTLISCTDSIWDGSFFIASRGTTIGDVIRFFIQRPDGSGAFTLMAFTVEADGVRLTQLFEQGALYRNNRLAQGGRVYQDELIPFVSEAGEAGRRTEPLTFSFQMRPDSPLNDCLQLGATLSRSTGAGTITLLITDIVVNRKPMPGDEDRPETGLIGGLATGYPTGRECQKYCAVCEEPPTKCDTFCFRSAAYWASNVRRFPSGKVFISGVNFNQAVSTKDFYALELALQGSTSSMFGQLAPQEQFNREWVAAQLNLLWAACGGSPNFYNVQWASLRCYGLSFEPVTLSNGEVITPNSMLKDLFSQAHAAAGRGNTADFLALAGLFNMLNGDDPRGVCN